MTDATGTAPTGSGSDDALLYNLMAAACPRVAPAPAPDLATPVTYTLSIAGAWDNAVVAGMFAASAAKAIGAQVCVCGADGQPVECYDPPRKRGTGGGRGSSGVAAGPRGPDWSSKSGQIVRMMMRDGGATMAEMRDLTGWSFGDKYAAQLARSFAVTISTHESVREKKTWRAAAIVAHAADVDSDDMMLLAAE